MANPTKETYVYEYEPDESGYQTVTYTWTDEPGKEYTYRLRFYRGLVSTVLLYPQGRGAGMPVRTLFKQTETYRFPGGKYDPIPDTTLTIDDVTDKKTVVLAVDDAPKSGRAGNSQVISTIYMKMYRTEGPPAPGNEWVTPAEGGKYVKGILVATRPSDVPPVAGEYAAPDWSQAAPVEQVQQQATTMLESTAAAVGLGDDPDPEIEVRNTPMTCPFDC